MKYGVHLPTTRASDEAPLAYQAYYVSTAAALGYEYLAVNDHFLGVLDPVVTMASVVGASGQMQLIPSNLLPIHRGLVPSAKLLATLDRLSGGRVIAGVGPGSQEFEYRINGIPFDDRWRRFDEIVQSVRSLLEGGEPFSGKYYSTEGVTLTPYPSRRPMPIWIGSWGSDAGLRRVARLADGWLSSALSTSAESFREARERLDQHLAAVGKDPATFPDALSTLQVYASADPARLKAIEERRRAAGARRAAAAPAAEGRHEMLPPLVGTPEQCAAGLSAFKEAGVRAVFIRPLEDHAEQLHVFKNEVIPLVR